MKHFLVSMIICACSVLWAGSKAEYLMLPVPDGSKCVEIANGYLYSGGKRHLTVFDISNPLSPRQAAVLENIGDCRQMVHRGSYLYISQREAGILIVDVSNPAKPRKAGFFATAELATGLATAGNLLFCAQRIFGVEVIDISDPVRLRPLALHRTFEAQSCTFRNNYLYVGDWEDAKLTVIDVRDPASPRTVFTHNLDGYGDGVCTDDKFCYAATGHHKKSGKAEERYGRGHGLEIFSIADPAAPEFVSRIDFPQLYTLGNDFWTVRVSNDTAVVADTHNGVFVVDVTDRKKPQIKRHITFPPEGTSKRNACCADIELGNGVVYASVLKTGVAVIPTGGVKQNQPHPDFHVQCSVEEKPAIPGWKRYTAGRDVRRVAVKGDTAYAASSMDGLKVIDLNTGKIKQSLPLACAYDVSVKQDRLYCAARADGIVTYKINSDGTLTEINKVKAFIRPGTGVIFYPKPQLIMAPSTGNTLFWADRGGWVYISDADNPQKILDRCRWIRIVYGDALPDDDINGIVPVHFCNFGTYWYDLKGGKVTVASRDDSMKDVSGRAKGGLMEAWSVLDGKFFAPSQKGITILDPAELGKNFKTYPAAGMGGSASIYGKTAVITDRWAGTVRVFDVSDLANPVEKKDFYLKLPGTPERAKFWNGHIVVPAGTDGLLVSEKQIDK